MSDRFNNKVAVVTGGTSGIGLATAKDGEHLYGNPCDRGREQPLHQSGVNHEAYGCRGMCQRRSVVPATLAVSAERGSRSPVFGVELPPGYRDWRLVSVAHEAGNNNDIRAILGNDIAVSAFQNGQRPFPDGAIIVRLAWQYLSSPANNAVFSTPQSFVAGAPTNVQVSVKDSARYAATGGWGYGQFEDGNPNTSETFVTTCFACHNKVVKSDDLVFTKYAQ